MRFGLIILIYFLFNILKAAPNNSNQNGSALYYEIPFLYINNLIILELEVNNLQKLKFIFDTGSENNLFFDKEIADFLNFKYIRNLTIYGSDIQRPIKALVSNNIKFDITDNVSKKTEIIVLEENPFFFSEMVGDHISGIIGNHFFINSIIEVDFKHNKLRCYHSHPSKWLKKHTLLPSIWLKNKPYIHIKTEINKVTNEHICLFDMGASPNLILYSNLQKELPAKIIPGNFGIGLGGNLSGFIGKLPSVWIHQFNSLDVITHYFEIDSSYLVHDQSGKSGIIGNGLLYQFNVVIDYQKQAIYLKRWQKKRSIYHDDFTGMALISAGANFEQTIVQSVLDQSPAYFAGFKVHDELISINRIPTLFYSLSKINYKLNKERKNAYRIKIKRNDEFIFLKLMPTKYL